MLAIDFKKQYLKDDVISKMAVIAVQKNNGFDYWFHVKDNQPLPNDDKYNIVLSKM